MGVMEQKREAAAPGTAPAKARHERRVGPFVHNDDIGLGQDVFMREAPPIGHGGQLRKVGSEPLQRNGALFGHQVAAAPAIGRLQRHRLMSTRNQVAHHATQEVCIAMVPVGHQGMGIEQETHSGLRFRQSGKGRANTAVNGEHGFRLAAGGVSARGGEGPVAHGLPQCRIAGKT